MGFFLQGKCVQLDVTSLSMAKPTESTQPPPAGPLDEAELLRAYRSGDRSAAERLVESTYSAVYAALFRLTSGDQELASDLTQETYRRAWQALPRFEGRSRLGTWLYRIAYTTFLNHIRGPRAVVRPLEPDGPELPEHGPSPEQRAASSAMDRRLRSKVLALPDVLRFTVTARYWGDHSVREIASAEKVTTVAIRKRLKKALSLLGEALGDVR